MNATTRRAALRGASLAGLLGIPAIAGATQANPDADLIRTCHLFAQREYESWYRYVIAPDDVECQETPPDGETYKKIVATPATTPEGWHAKALALAAWDREAYDNEDASEYETELLSSLLRDMVTPARSNIIAGLRAKYGPLPSSYSADGIWIGLSEEEKEALAAKYEALAAEQADFVAAQIAEQQAAVAEIHRRSNVETMTREELVY